MKKSLLIFSCLLLLVACSEPDHSEIKGPKPFISMGSNNSSETSIELEEIILDGKWDGIATGYKGCGSSNINGGGGGGPLWETPLPMETIYVKWYSWKEMKNIEATVTLPPREILKQLYVRPPWFNPEKSRAESTIIVNIRPNKEVWIKLSKDSRPESQEEVMIIGEATGVVTSEKVTRYKHFEEGKDYILDCKSFREESKKLGYYTAPLEVWDKWYPGAPQNKESHHE